MCTHLRLVRICLLCQSWCSLLQQLPSACPAGATHSCRLPLWYIGAHMLCSLHAKLLLSLVCCEATSSSFKDADGTFLGPNAAYNIQLAAVCSATLQ